MQTPASKQLNDAFIFVFVVVFVFVFVVMFVFVFVFKIHYDSSSPSHLWVGPSKAIIAMISDSQIRGAAHFGFSGKGGNL